MVKFQREAIINLYVRLAAPTASKLHMAGYLARTLQGRACPDMRGPGETGYVLQ